MITIIIPVYNNADTIRGTIDSIRSQSYQDYEVILVNDGSTDDSGKVIRESIGNDPRFKYIEQENQGVSAARNRGLEEATMKYVTFTDGDDLLTQNALKWMHQVAVTNDADTITGIFRKVDGTYSYINRKSEKITLKALRINNDDLDMINTWTLCNKWLSRDIIEKHHIRFEKRRHVEDGVFLYTYLQYAEKIYGCQHIVYTYIKPLPFMGRTSTQNISADLLHDATGSFERLSELTASYGEDFHRELTRKYIHTPWIGDYYRRLWKLDPQTADELNGLINTQYKCLDPERQQALEADHFDIFRDGRLLTRDEILASPIAAIVLTDGISSSRVTDILDGIYDQYEPSFVIIADEKLKDAAGERYAVRDNLIWTDGSRLLRSAGESSADYIAVLNHDMMFNHESLFRMIRELEKDRGADVVAMRYDNYVNGEVAESEVSACADDKDMSGLDVLLADKVLRNRPDIIECLEKGADGADILERFSSIRMQRPRMLSLIPEEDVIRLIGSEEAVREYRQYLKKSKTSGADDLKAVLRKLLRKFRKKKEKKKAKVTAEDCYLNLDVRKGTILVEGLGKRPKGSSLYILKELSGPEYRDFEVYFSATSETEDFAREVLEREHLDKVNIVRTRTEEYKKLLFSAEYLFNEVDFPVWWIKKPGQTYVNIWHGTPLKKLGKKKPGAIHRDAVASHNFTMADYMLFANDYSVDHILRDMDAEAITCAKGLMLGYPRTGILFDETVREKVRRECALEDKNVSVWMPTWNDSQTSEDMSGFLKEIDGLLGDDQVLFVNLHHRTGAGIVYDDMLHVRRFPDGYDNYEFLTAADSLITDYSSVFFDYAVTRKKIILHCPDQKQYSDSRGLYMEPSALPFPVTQTAEELAEEMRTPRGYDDAEFLRTYNRYDSADNAKKLCGAVILGRTDGVEIRDFEKDSEAVFIVADSFSSDEMRSWLKEAGMSERWNRHTYLSFPEEAAEEYAEEITPLLRKVNIYATSGKSMSERTERKRLYGDMTIKRFVLIDPSDAGRIRAFAHFTEPVQMILTERQMKLLRTGDDDMLQAVKLFGLYGSGIRTLDAEDAAWLKEKMEIEAGTVTSAEEFCNCYL